MEECDILLGKDHLLKRSIVLLKAWWLYETRAFSGQTMLMSVSDFALSTMLLCSINKHHRKLHHPLQVLAMFFSQFSKLNWEKEVVTLGGVVEIGPGGGLGNPVVGQSEDTFIPAEVRRAISEGVERATISTMSNYTSKNAHLSSPTPLRSYLETNLLNPRSFVAAAGAALPAALRAEPHPRQRKDIEHGFRAHERGWAGRRRGRP